MLDKICVKSPNAVRYYFAGILALILICAALVYVFVVARSEFDALTNVESTVTRWSPHEVELCHLKLLNTVQSAAETDGSKPQSVQRSFYNFTDTVEKLTNSSLFRSVIEHPSSRYNLEQIQSFLHRWAPEIASGGKDLIAAMPQLFIDTTAIKVDVQALAASGVADFTRQQDMHRMKLKVILTRNWAVFSGLTLILVALVIVLVRLNRHMKARGLLIERDRKRMSAIVSASLDGIILTNPEGYVSEYNEAAQQIFGWGRNDAIGMKVDEFFATNLDNVSRRDENSKATINLFSAGREQGRVRVEGCRKGGGIFPAEVVVVSASNTDPSIVIFVRDISFEVKAETTLRKARDKAIAGEKSKSRLLAVMSHEIRTPLNGLMGCIELLDDTALSGTQHQYLQNMKKAGGVLLAQVNDVLDISRLEADHEALQIEHFDLISVIAETIRLQHALTQERGNSIIFEGYSELSLPVSADRLKLSRMILNVVSNARVRTH